MLYKIFYVLVLVFLSNNAYSQLSDLTASVMDQLNINIKDCESLFAEKVLPYNKDLSVIVIPKIGQKEEDMFSLDSYVVVVNNKTKKIKHLYFESYKTSGWESDAIFIYEVSIDTAKYLVQDSVRAFGVVLHTRNMSQPNPYNSRFISLFIPDGDKLQNILKNYEIFSYGGETDMNCFAEMNTEEKTLSLSKAKSNDYFNINVNVLHTLLVSKQKEGTSCESSSCNYSDCIETKTLKKSKQILQFLDGAYKQILNN